jgi:predicted PurR-regulated permease PerM
VGAFGGFVLAAVVGILEHGVIGSLVRAVLVFGAGEIFEGYVLVPRILGDKLGLHPLVVFFALFAGGAALGMLGLLIALPLTATLVVLFQEFVLPALKQFADEAP